MVSHGNRLAKPARDEQFRDPIRALDSRGWLGDSVAGKRILCLAAGGGKLGPLLAAAGGDVTVVDLSPAMLELDRTVASERGLALRTIAASMDDLSILEPNYFDIVSHPVSTCYVPDVVAVYHQVARVMRNGGLYISQHKQPASLQAAVKPISTPSGTGYLIDQQYYRSDPLPETEASLHREPKAMEFVHRWEDLLGGMCRAGFVIEDVVEPVHAKPNAASGTFADRSQYLPPYVRVKARKRVAATGDSGTPAGKLWTP